MDLLINVILLVVGFIGALTAIGGETWRKEASSLVHRITRRGWVAIVCLISILALGGWKEFRSDAQASKLRAERVALEARLRGTSEQLTKSNETLASTQGRLEEVTTRLGQANDQLAQSRRKIAALEPTLLQAMYTLTEGIPRESDFAFVSLRGRTREIPRSSRTNRDLLLYGGDEFEYTLLCSGGEAQRLLAGPLLLRAGSREYPLERDHDVIRIAGPVGQAMPAEIVSRGRPIGCDVKIIVKSTDRTRLQTQLEPVLAAIRRAKADLDPGAD